MLISPFGHYHTIYTISMIMTISNDLYKKLFLTLVNDKFFVLSFFLQLYSGLYLKICRLPLSLWIPYYYYLSIKHTKNYSLSLNKCDDHSMKMLNKILVTDSNFTYFETKFYKVNNNY